MFTVQAFDHSGRHISERSFIEEREALEQQEKWERNPEVSEVRILGESSIEQIDVPENELKKPVMKKYRIIIELTGDSPIVEANDAEEAEDHFVSEVTGDQFLQLLTISAEAIEL
jgi:hypothetical protein